MKIFKENSYDIVRLYINQLGIMIFSMLLYTAVGSFENESLSTSLSVFVSIFSTCFYLALIYYMMWEIGAKDKIRIDGGRMVPCTHPKQICRRTFYRTFYLRILPTFSRLSECIQINNCPSAFLYGTNPAAHCPQQLSGLPLPAFTH